ncbi:hypothetical protein HMY34_15230 [Thiothrix subterranea]|uniref:hypothetical protein n=1 Tax=Thiothrix subterranea TaxID=2735563 RepID=UPI00192A843C|nr:hypothetical protein [Thiothrix subterranea]QQZ30004.1 hypothetical protein HMY34_15230 [Thiothrix subterranea]
MKRLQGIMLSAACLAASQVQAQEPPAAAPQAAPASTLTFPTPATATASTPSVQPPPTAANVGQPGPPPRTAVPQAMPPVQQQPAVAAYPYNSYPTNYNYNNYGYSAYPYGYYPYAQQQQAYRAYNPYVQQYNPYAAQRMMPYPQRPPVQQKKEVKPWGDTRYIWPDFYTDFTGDAFDKMINAPYDMGRMPGGIRFPSISMPDPVTVGDAIANQVPPFAEEAGNMVPADDVGNIMPFK